MSAVPPLYRCVDAFVDALLAGGVEHVCLCPGSRSAPLALAFARRPECRLWVHLDERSAAFFALGLARASRGPVALVCTSGTAVANFLPAVVEASLAHIPLVLCTADRPPELHQVGANQTIEQQTIFGGHVRLALTMPLPDAEAATERYFRHMAGWSIAVARRAPAGPVHCNFPFREPLVPAAPLPPAVPDPGAPLPAPPRSVASATAVATVEAQLRAAPRGLIVCGGQDDPAFPDAITALAARTRFPVLAEPLSGVRCGEHHGDLVLDGYDAFLRVPEFAAAPPDLVLRCGAAPTSKPLLEYLEQHARCPQVLLTDGAWSDPALVTTAVLEGDPTTSCCQLATALAEHEPGAATVAWAKRWLAADRISRETLHAVGAAFAAPFEGRVFQELAALLPPESLLVAGNSMPVRDLDTFFPGSRRPLRFLANRGASGIDGVVSTALGAAAASGRPTVLVIGDLSFYHDMNGLLAARQYGLSLTVVLVNNDGGGIFSFLPHAGQAEHFERLFGTPHGLDFSAVGALYGATYCRPRSWETFATAIRDGLTGGGLHVVEVRTDRAENVRQHRLLWQRVAARLQAADVAATATGRETAPEAAR